MNFVNNKNMKKKILIKNLLFLVPIFILLVLSILNMYGASFISPLYKNAFNRQIIWILMSMLVFIIIYKMDMNLLYKTSDFFYIIGIILLILVLFIGKSINGASSWFKIGALSIQPSEILKCFFIVYLSKVINKHKKGDFTLLLKILILTFIPCILIFLEPDTGVVVMYLLIMFGCILASKIKKRYLIIIMGCGLILLGIFLGLYFLKKNLFIDIFGTSFFYRMDRLLSFKNNSSYQLTNALIGIGASGIFGMGLTSTKIYIPEAITDFVFDLTILNFGYLTGIAVVLIYTFILIMIYREIYYSKKYLYRCILSGIFWMMLFQVFEHILMNLGLTPITGITLPFLSYGGSSMLSYSMIFAVVFIIINKNMSRFPKDKKR